MIPYGRQWVDEDDVSAVADVLRSDWLTTGPKVAEFEESFAQVVGARHAVAVNSGTAALHATLHALGVRPGDEVIVPAMTFAATANCVIFQGATPVFADVDPDRLLLRPDEIEIRCTPRTRAVIAVDYAGHPANYEAICEICLKHGLSLVADACHALGALYKGQPVGTLADLSAFSFHPVKHITTGEGGMVTTNDPNLARRMRIFRNHGITSDHRERERRGSWYYEMVELGWNYRITDIQCALGLSQLKKLPRFLERRREIAVRYDRFFQSLNGIRPLVLASDVTHAYHLYVVRVDPKLIGKDRDRLYRELRAEGIGVNVHYLPVHLHPYYRGRLNTGEGMCPVAEEAARHILSLPIHPGMNDAQVDAVCNAIRKLTSQD